MLCTRKISKAIVEITYIHTLIYSKLCITIKYMQDAMVGKMITLWPIRTYILGRRAYINTYI